MLYMVGQLYPACCSTKVYRGGLYGKQCIMDHKVHGPYPEGEGLHNARASSDMYILILIGQIALRML